MKEVKCCADVLLVLLLQIATKVYHMEAEA